MSESQFRNNHHFVKYVRLKLHDILQKRGLADEITTNSAENLTVNSALYLRPIHTSKPSMQLIPSPKRHLPGERTLLDSTDEILNNLELKLNKTCWDTDSKKMKSM